MLNIYDICGFIAGLLFPLSLIPQIYKSYKTKNLDDISYYWQFIFILALLLALVYSFHYDLMPIYVSSSIELLFMVILTSMKFCYRNKFDLPI